MGPWATSCHGAPRQDTPPFGYSEQAVFGQGLSAVELLALSTGLGTPAALRGMGVCHCPRLRCAKCHRSTGDFVIEGCASSFPGAAAEKKGDKTQWRTENRPLKIMTG